MNLKIKLFLKNTMLSPKDIGLSNTSGVFFIAEAGINHNGSLDKAKESVDLAKRAGADAILTYFAPYVAKTLNSSD